MRAHLNASFPPEKYLLELRGVTEIAIGPVSWNDDYTRIYEEFIQKCIDANAPLTSFALRDSTHIQALPGNLPKDKITRISIVNCKQLVEIGNIFQDFPNLESFHYQGKEIILGGNIPVTNQLKILSLDAAQIDSVVGVLNFKNLESLGLINLNIKELPSLENFSELKSLTLKELKSLEKLDVNFRSLPGLISVHLEAIGRSDVLLKLPDSVTSLSQLESLFLKKICFSELPEAIGQLKEIKKITFTELNITALPDVFDCFHKLEKLEISHCFQLTSLPDSIKRIPRLQELSLNYLSSLETINFDDHQLFALTSFSIFGLTNLKAIHFDTTACEALNHVGLYYSSALEEVSKNLFAAGNLEYIRLVKLESLKSIPDSIVGKKTLKELKIEDCISLEYIPGKIIPAKQHFNFTAEKINPVKFNEVEKSLNTDLNWNVEVAYKSFVVDWILHKEKPVSIAKAEGDAVLKTMAVGHKRISEELIKHVYGLNPTARPISTAAIGEGGKVYISGRLTGGKNSVKGKLEALKLKLVSKLTDDVSFILLGKKPKFTEDLFNGQRIFFSQMELERLKKAEHPEMLQKKETPEAVVKNLNQLIYSKNEVDLKLAFEMVQQHGLPTELEEGFLVIYHTMPKGKFRNQIKTFLKEKLNEQKQQILDSKTYPFAPHKVLVLTKEEATKIYYTLYQRTGEIRLEFFGVSPVDFSDRRKMFTEILPSLTKNPKRINIGAVLTTDELDELLSLPKFKGQLKEIIITYPDNGEPIKGFEMHKDSLRKLKIYFQQTATSIPDCIYDAINLTELTLMPGGAREIPTGIHKLTSLKILYIYSRLSAVKIPSDVVELKKLKKFNCSPGDSLDSFKAKMPWVF